MFTRLFEPYHTLSDLQRSLEELSGTNWFASGTGSSGTYPPVNVFKQGDNFLVLSELPGVSKEEVDIEVNNNRLRIKGTKKPLYGENVSVHRVERRVGDFDRTVTFPVRIDPAGVKAEYQDGILAVHMPAADSEKPRNIEIQ
ncbi:MAG: Hsp20/alpha crystallin family protein [Gammaproteobacteria bacterium]